MVALLLCSPISHFGAKAPLNQCLPRDEHITLVTPWARDSALIQYENGVLHVPVNKIYPEVGAIGGPTWAPLNRKVYLWGHMRKGHLVIHQGGREKCWSGCS